MEVMRVIRCRFTIILFFFLLHLCSAKAAKSSVFNITTIPFNRGFTPLFGDANILRSPDDRTVKLHLNQFTGSGFRSSDLYNHGFFSAKIKLPSDYTAGIVVAFYTTNVNIFEKTHDELDFEFLGNIRKKPWRFQTNMYGNGSTSRGREERYTLWFDPSEEFHRYSILWTTSQIIFFIDEVPIREIIRKEEMGGDWPSKPMGLYATIWDASDWATSGGRYKADYKYAPFIAEFTDLVLQGRATDPLEQVVTSTTSTSTSTSTDDIAWITPRQRAAAKRFRQKYMYYSYCLDRVRYPTPPPECVIDPSESQMFKETGRLKFDERHHHNNHRRPKRKNNQVLGTRNYGDSQGEV